MLDDCQKCSMSMTPRCCGKELNVGHLLPNRQDSDPRGQGLPICLPTREASSPSGPGPGGLPRPHICGVQRAEGPHMEQSELGRVLPLGCRLSHHLMPLHCFTWNSGTLGCAPLDPDSLPWSPGGGSYF